MSQASDKEVLNDTTLLETEENGLKPDSPDSETNTPVASATFVTDDKGTSSPLASSESATTGLTERKTMELEQQDRSTVYTVSPKTSFRYNVGDETAFMVFQSFYLNPLVTAVSSIPADQRPAEVLKILKILNLFWSFDRDPETVRWLTQRDSPSTRRTEDKGLIKSRKSPVDEKPTDPFKHLSLSQVKSLQSMFLDIMASERHIDRKLLTFNESVLGADFRRLVTACSSGRPPSVDKNRFRKAVKGWAHDESSQDAKNTGAVEAQTGGRGSGRTSAFSQVNVKAPVQSASSGAPSKHMFYDEDRVKLDPTQTRALTVCFLKAVNRSERTDSEGRQLWDDVVPIRGTLNFHYPGLLRPVDPKDDHAYMAYFKSLKVKVKKLQRVRDNFLASNQGSWHLLPRWFEFVKLFNVINIVGQALFENASSRGVPEDLFTDPIPLILPASVVTAWIGAPALPPKRVNPHTPKTTYPFLLNNNPTELSKEQLKKLYSQVPLSAYQEFLKENTSYLGLEEGSHIQTSYQ